MKEIKYDDIKKGDYIFHKSSDGKSFRVLEIIKEVKNQEGGHRFYIKILESNTSRNWEDWYTYRTLWRETKGVLYKFENVAELVKYLI